MSEVTPGFSSSSKFDVMSLYDVRTKCAVLDINNNMFDLYSAFKWISLPSQCGGAYISNMSVAVAAQDLCGLDDSIFQVDYFGSRRSGGPRLRWIADLPFSVRLSYHLKAKELLTDKRFVRQVHHSQLGAIHRHLSDFCTLILSDNQSSWRTGEQSFLGGYRCGAVAKSLKLHSLPQAMNTNSGNNIKFFASYREARIQNSIPTIKITIPTEASLEDSQSTSDVSTKDKDSNLDNRNTI